ncbi:MAG: hypothetical protein CBD16_09940 [Betaproteobacteria bacterium TMED156]|jgi:hypothetical protein|nr:MAG: hypothetical protein CBD16_09940 [Betaproteobacteria bacterium TMED156]|tara:strand:- start:84 stop:254 length:171 start_codon:yes stop_codon:yes gene_type:complete
MLKFILKLFLPSQKTFEEKYLEKSTDHSDLERRQRELDRRQFNGGSFRTLYNKFYI